ncbi:MAG: hypothetical protein ACI8WB_001575 [Phenylobacterium sp.]|jgi:hypothetical protein
MEILARLLRHTVLLITFMLPMASAIADDLRPQVASLVSSPGRCELKAGQKVCRMTLNLIWEAPNNAHYCIGFTKRAEPIKCWKDAWRGSVEIPFSAKEKTFFMLKQASSDSVLVETSVSVTGSYQQRKRAQRRKRGFWRMF